MNIKLEILKKYPYIEIIHNEKGYTLKLKLKTNEKDLIDLIDIITDLLISLILDERLNIIYNSFLRNNIKLSSAKGILLFLSDLNFCVENNYIFEFELIFNTANTLNEL